MKTPSQYNKHEVEKERLTTWKENPLHREIFPVYHYKHTFILYGTVAKYAGDVSGDTSF